MSSATRAEIRTVVDLVLRRSPSPDRRLWRRRFADVPLSVHARYQREEILAALDFPAGSPRQLPRGRLVLPDRNVDAFFVTLQEVRGGLLPHDHVPRLPDQPDLFHWESQSTTSVASPTGQRYLSGSSTVLLFVRQDRKDESELRPISSSVLHTT